MKRLLVLVTALTVIATACGSDKDTATTDKPTSSTSTTTTSKPADDFDVKGFVETISSDAYGGRDNDTEGSTMARHLIIDTLSKFAQPAFPEAKGDDRFLQPVDGGTNVLGIIPGSDLAKQYVVIGAHYDHLGSGEDCQRIPATPPDDICNGAADNATGVAATLSIARSLAAGKTPRRTVIIGFWDREEDDFQGSLGYLAAPVAPLADTIAYVNFDIQGANLLPTLKNLTVMVGAETGGPNLVTAATAATKASTLDTEPLSLIFGQGRSDHAKFVEHGVASVFFTDANNGCYHTTDDEADHVDFAKLTQQIKTAGALVGDLVATDKPPAFTPDVPVSSFEDAVSLLAIVEHAKADLGLLPASERASTEQYITDLHDIVDAGAAKYDAAATGKVIAGAAQVVSALRKVPCGSF